MKRGEAEAVLKKIREDHGDPEPNEKLIREVQSVMWKLVLVMRSEMDRRSPELIWKVVFDGKNFGDPKKGWGIDLEELARLLAIKVHHAYLLAHDLGMSTADQEGRTWVIWNEDHFSKICKALGVNNDRQS